MVLRSLLHRLALKGFAGFSCFANAGMPLQGQQQPQPLLVPKKGLQPLPNPRQSLARAKKESHGRPWLSLCFGIAGRRDDFFISKPGQRLIFFFIHRGTTR
jgi:hypothetical protein